MSPYPPYPLFTFIGFLIHSVVFFSISIRFLRRYQGIKKEVLYLGLGTLAFAIDFFLIVILFFFFPNNLLKTMIFVFDAMVIVPLASLALILSVMHLNVRLKRFVWLAATAGILVIVIFYFYTIALIDFQNPLAIRYSYVHPAYPFLITKGQALGGLIGGILVGIFFLHRGALTDDLSIKRRAIIVGIASVMLGMSSFYWTSVMPSVYLATHTIGPLGSLLLAVGIFWYAIPQRGSLPGAKVSPQPHRGRGDLHRDRNHARESAAAK